MVDISLFQIAHCVIGSNIIVNQDVLQINHLHCQHEQEKACTFKNNDLVSDALDWNEWQLIVKINFRDTP